MDKSKKEVKNELKLVSGMSKGVDAPEAPSPGTIRREDVELPNDILEAGSDAVYESKSVLTTVEDFNYPTSSQLPHTSLFFRPDEIMKPQSSHPPIPAAWGSFIILRRRL